MGPTHVGASERHADEAGRLSVLRAIRALWVLPVLLCCIACSPPPPRPPCRLDTSFGTVCGFENPEDLEYVAPGRLLVSNLRMNGRGGFLSVSVSDAPPIRLWPSGSKADRNPTPGIGDDTCPPPDPEVFAPHGIYVDQRDGHAGHLYVVNHGGRQAIEIFDMQDASGRLTLTWLACIPFPDGASGNDVAVAPDGEIIASNYLPSTGQLWANLKLLYGGHTGDVLAWRRGRGWQHVPDSAASGANGVEVSADGKWLFFAATGGGTLTRIARDGSAPTRSVRVPGLPDNLSWTARGTLLLPTHDSARAFLKCARALPCRSPWRLLEIDPQTLSVTERFHHDGELLGAVAAAAAAGDVVYLSAVFGDRIGVLRGEF